MALSNLADWTGKTQAAPAAACGTACGAGDKHPTPKPRKEGRVIRIGDTTK